MIQRMKKIVMIQKRSQTNNMKLNKADSDKINTHIFHLLQELTALTKTLEKKQMSNLKNIMDYTSCKKFCEELHTLSKNINSISEIQCESCKEYFEESTQMYISPLGLICIDCHGEVK